MGPDAKLSTVLWWLVRHGHWDCGYDTNWPGKPMFGFFWEYYDGWHTAFHLGCFYVGISEWPE